MLDLAWLFIGLIGLVATIAAVATDENEIAIVAGLLGMFAWLLWSFGAYAGIETASGTEYQMWPVALLGTAIALVPGFIALTGPIEILGNAYDTTRDDF